MDLTSLSLLYSSHVSGLLDVEGQQFGEGRKWAFEKRFFPSTDAPEPLKVKPQHIL